MAVRDVGRQSGQKGTNVDMGGRTRTTITPSTTVHQDVSTNLHDTRRDASTKGRGVTSRSGISVASLHGPPERQTGTETGGRPVGLKPPHLMPPVSNADPQPGPRVTDSRGLVHLPRPGQRILAHTNTPQIPIFPGGAGRRPCPTVHSLTVRSQHSATSFHQDHQDGGSATGRRGRACLDVLGRLARPRNVRRRGTDSNSDNVSSLQGPGISIQHHQVSSLPDTDHHVAGDEVGCTSINAQSLRRQQRKSTGQAPENSDGGQLQPQAVGKFVGVPQLRGPSRPFGSIVVSQTVVGREPPVPQDVPLPSTSDTSPHPPPPTPVAGAGTSAFDGTLENTNTTAVGVHRCIRHRLGLSSFIRTPRARFVVSERQKEARQCEGIDGASHIHPATSPSEADAHLLPHGQRGCSPMHQEDGIIQITSPPSGLRTPLPHGSVSSPDSHSSARPWAGQCMGRCIVPQRNIFRGMGTRSRRLHGPHRSLWSTRRGPLRVSPQPSSSPLHHQDDGNTSGRARRTTGGLEQVGIYISFSSTSSHSHDSCLREAGSIQRPSTSGGSLMEGATMVPTVATMVPSSTTPQQAGGNRSWRPTIGDVLRFSRLEFLQECLATSLSPAVTDDIISGSRKSTLRQYQSAWTAFQLYLRNRPFSHMSVSIIYDFLSYMFHSRKRAAPTISTYAAALADPLRFGFGIEVRSRILDLMRRGFFIQRPPTRRHQVFWSLRKVLEYLRGPEFSIAPDPRKLLHKALFLVAMASGLRASQLHALVRHPSWLVFAADGRQMSLAPSPKFIAKNEREGHTLSPIVIQAWMEQNTHHPLCPVGVLRQYVRATSTQAPTRLFVWPDTFKPLSRLHISKILCGVIEKADPGKAPKGHDVRAMSATMAFLRHYSVDRVRQDGQWASDRSFVTHYLDHSLEEVPCVTIAGPPPPEPPSPD